MFTLTTLADSVQIKEFSPTTLGFLIANEMFGFDYITFSGKLVGYKIMSLNEGIAACFTRQVLDNIGWNIGDMLSWTKLNDGRHIAMNMEIA